MEVSLQAKVRVPSTYMKVIFNWHILSATSVIYLKRSSSHRIAPWRPAQRQPTILWKLDRLRTTGFSLKKWKSLDKALASCRLDKLCSLTPLRSLRLDSTRRMQG